MAKTVSLLEKKYQIAKVVTPSIIWLLHSQSSLGSVDLLGSNFLELFQLVLEKMMPQWLPVNLLDWFRLILTDFFQTQLIFQEMGNGGRSCDDLDMEQALKTDGLTTPDVIKSALDHKSEGSKISETTIDSLFGVPEKIVIPERYIPDTVSIIFGLKFPMLVTLFLVSLKNHSLYFLTRFLFGILF